MQAFHKISLSLAGVLFSLFSFSQEQNAQLWILNSLSEINGHVVEVLGSPEVIDTDLGAAIEFDGVGDRILVNNNPIGLSKAFTVEVIFKPYGNSLNRNSEPRFIHIQNPNDAQSKRVMMEIRVNSENKMYLDGFMLTDNDNLTLVDVTKTHNTDEWIHAAISFENNVFTTYVNGVEELGGEVTYATNILETEGKTSIGARMNERNWYNGVVKCLKITQARLTPEQFLNFDDFKCNGIYLLNETEKVVYYLKKLQILMFSNFEDDRSMKVQVFDLQGRKINSSIITKEYAQISTQGWQNGLYIVQFGEQIQRIRIN